MDWSANPWNVKAKQSAVSADSFLKRRRDEDFVVDLPEEESPSKKARPVVPEILPRIHHLHTPLRQHERRRHSVSDRQWMRKKAARRALVQSLKRISPVDVKSLTECGVKEDHPLLQMARSSSLSDESYDHIAVQPIEKEPDLSGRSPEEAPEEDSFAYGKLEDGKYRLDLEMVLHVILPEVDFEFEAHEKWLKEVESSIAKDINACMKLDPKYRSLCLFQRNDKFLELSRWKEDEFNKDWHKACNDNDFKPPIYHSLDTQIAMSISEAVQDNPLPEHTSQAAIEKYVEMVQRKGIDYHRTHNRRFLYLWKQKVRELREQATGMRDEANNGIQEAEARAALLSAEACAVRNVAVIRSPCTQAEAKTLRATLTKISPKTDILPTVPYEHLTEHTPMPELWQERFAGDAGTHEPLFVPNGELLHLNTATALSATNEMLSPVPSEVIELANTSTTLPGKPEFAIDPLLLAAGTDAVSTDTNLDLPDLSSLPRFDWPVW